MTQLGRALTILVLQEVREGLQYADLGAFHAPSECYALVKRGEVWRDRTARRHAKAVSGLNRRMFRRAKSRLGRAHEKLYAALWAKHGGAF